MEAQAIRIVIADPYRVFRDQVRCLLEAEPSLKIIGETSDGIEAIKLARQLKPDILLLDLDMLPKPGQEALSDLSAGSIGVKVILLTEKHEIVEALTLGARGVILKHYTKHFLLKSIRSVMTGEYWAGHESVSDLAQYLRKTLRLFSVTSFDPSKPRTTN